MNNEKMNQMIDNAWMNFSNKHHGILFVSKDDFIERIKDDPKFSKKWGLKIEERELTTVRERKKYDRYFDDLIGEYPDHHETLDKRGVPRKIIKITYNGETIESYE